MVSLHVKSSTFSARICRVSPKRQVLRAHRDHGQIGANALAQLNVLTGSKPSVNKTPERGSISEGACRQIQNHPARCARRTLIY